MKIISIAILLFSLSAHAQIGFSLGTNFSSVGIDGELRVVCSDPSRANEEGIFWCHDNILEPSTYDYFVGPANTEADTVMLNAVSTDGSYRTKTQDYNSEQNRTEDPVNLWINTPFQTPLLKEGRNKISYTLSANNKQVTSGNFEVIVMRAKPRTCESEVLQTSNFNECHSQYSACQNYFQRHRYCR